MYTAYNHQGKLHSSIPFDCIKKSINHLSADSLLFSEIHHETACFSSVCFFTLSKIADNNFSECKKFLNNVPPDFTAPAGVSVVPICQCVWDDNDEQIYLYASLYSTTWKIPVYSVYVFGSPNIRRCDTWYIEPQLDGDPEPCMRTKGHIHTDQRSSAKSTFNRNAWLRHEKALIEDLKYCDKESYVVIGVVPDTKVIL
uniref:Uncharacterized protein n=1 Tax=Cyprinus carpio TaxID=7962 RepID=A0A8C1S2T4_CYPCA